MTELEIYKRALQRIANLNCRSVERYIARVDEIAIDALVAGENVDNAIVKDDVVSGTLPRAA